VVVRSLGKKSAPRRQKAHERGEGGGEGRGGEGKGGGKEENVISVALKCSSPRHPSPEWFHPGNDT